MNDFILSDMKRTNFTGQTLSAEILENDDLMYSVLEHFERRSNESQDNVSSDELARFVLHTTDFSDCIEKDQIVKRVHETYL